MSSIKTSEIIQCWATSNIPPPLTSTATHLCIYENDALILGLQVVFRVLCMMMIKRHEFDDSKKPSSTKRKQHYVLRESILKNFSLFPKNILRFPEKNTKRLTHKITTTTTTYSAILAQKTIRFLVRAKLFSNKKFKNNLAERSRPSSKVTCL